MFSYQNQDSFDVTIAPFEENVLDTLARAGVEVVWRDNNSGSKHVADRVTYQDYSRPVNESYVCAGECRDETLLTGLDELIRSSNGDVLIVLHQMGSHGPAYFQRYDETFEVFTPVCLSSELSQCTQNEIINAYDNSIIYTDYVINESIKLLEKFNAYSTNVIYISDHGESLGEAGLYLHGLPYGFAPESQTHVPAMVWSGDRSNIDRALTSKNSENVYTHDNLAQTLLSLFGISTTNSKELPQSFIVFR
jgi:lipid A ethanolaminephosphotransferase